MGRFLVLLLVVSTVLAGGGMYYLQVYGYYRTLDPASPEAALTVVTGGGEVALPVTGLRAIDSDSSPIRFRACATLAAALPDGALPYDDPVPLTAPGWFDCFDAAAIGAALERGEARAFLSRAHFPWGVGRVLAAFPDGRIFVWPQINACGREVFEGKPLPPGCPPQPARVAPIPGN
ncbi:MAG TPA: DUF6446 family protein [Paracoccaceae bacterium]|nr:DUF6446 family protein [Paracoccaceae bacterium]